MDHDPITTKVHPVFVRIAADGDVESSNIPSAIALVPERNWQGKQIDFLSFENIFRYRAGVHHSRRKQSRMVKPFFPGRDKLITCVIERKVIGETLSLKGRVMNTGED